MNIKVTGSMLNSCILYKKSIFQNGYNLGKGFFFKNPPKKTFYDLNLQRQFSQSISKTSWFGGSSDKDPEIIARKILHSKIQDVLQKHPEIRNVRSSKNLVNTDEHP